VGRENILKPIRNDSRHQNSNENDVRVVNFDTSKNPGVKSLHDVPAPRHHKYTWNPRDGKTHNKIDR